VPVFLKVRAKETSGNYHSGGGIHAISKIIPDAT
jgi:hypothetical protein